MEPSQAVNSLRKAIRKLVERYERRQLPSIPPNHPAQIEAILQHMEACLSTLVNKHRSLRAAMRALESHHKHYKDFQQLFSILIGLRDGLVLLESGECRHRGDLQKARGTSMPSQLPTETRADGYTVLYSKDATYSGLSWDEFTNGTSGLQQRLSKAIRPLLPTKQRDAPWEALLEMSGEGIEMLLSSIQLQVQENQQAFSKLRDRIVSDLKSDPNVKHVKLSLQDKMEEFHVQTGSAQFQFKRRGLQFRVNDPDGVLPVLSESEWLKRWSPNTVASKPTAAVRRNILVDSDDEAKEKQTPPVANSSGLVVHVKKKTKDAAQPVDESINEIKSKMGVNQDQLAASREVLEAEEAVSSRAANHLDSLHVDDEEYVREQEKGSLELAKSNVLRLRRIYNKSLRYASSEDDLWNDREELREALMAAGNLYLATLEPQPDLRVGFLRSAVDCFAEALSLVEVQAKLLDKISQGMSSAEKLVYGRSLRLLRGQAHLNRAVASLDLSREVDRKTRKFLRRRVQRDCEEAVAIFEALESMTARSQETGDVDTIGDMLRSKELLAHTNRVMAMLMWARKDFEGAVDLFRQGATRVGNVGVTVEEDVFLARARLQAMAEGYLCWAMMAELTASMLERMTTTERMKSGERLLAWMREALEQSEQSSGDLFERARSEDLIAILEEKGVVRREDIVSYGKEMMNWWETSTKSLENEPKRVPMLRSDLRGFQEPSPNAPRIFVTSKVVRNQTRQSRRCAPGGRAPIVPKKYRPWGDDRFPKVKDAASGKWVPKLPEACYAPVMPPEILAHIGGQ